MRAGLVLVLSLIVITSVAFADEKLPVLKAAGETYSNVTVIKVTATDVYFISDKGLANAKLQNLDPALQKHFHYDPAKAAAEQKREAANTRVQLRAIGTGNASSIAEIKSQMDSAISRVKEIVNQPVESLPRTPDMQVATYSPGWFHPGAEKPDFNTVDVRATRLLPYDQHQYVTSDLNPGVVFIGSELEFNPMTKYFYTDRSVPKKKLTEAEMLEINRLYRLIGKCEQRLDRMQNPLWPLTAIYLWLVTHKPIVIAMVAVLFVALLFLRKRPSQGL
jgi:hypothetical protein